MSKLEFCPADCFFDPDSEHIGIRLSCQGCAHFKDIVMEPRKGILLFPQGGEVDVLGRNGDVYYVRQMRSDGGSYVSTVHKSKVKFT